MLTSIVRWSLRFRGIVVALACALLGYGIYSLTQAKYDVFPEFAPPQVSIQTEAPGLSPEQVEVLVTQPIENAINGVAGIATLRSGSIQGLSVITVVFEPSSDIYRDRQVVAERLTGLASSLPQGVKSPLITPLTSSTSVVLNLGLTSDTKSLMSVRTVADWIVRQRLLAVPGAAKVSVFGGEVRQVQVQFDPQRLIQHGLTVDDILTASRRATGIRGAGFIDTVNQRLVLQSEGQSLTSDQIAKTVVLHESGSNLTLGEVAQVKDAPEPRIGAAAVMGKPGVVLVVSGQLGTNTLEVTRSLERALAELRPALDEQGIALYPNLFRPATFIETALHNVRTSLIIGAVLVVVVLVLFLFNFRTAAISCTAIPLSLLAAVVVIERLGFSINTMTLGGLAIAIGEVVDDAVIDVENILRRLRENRALQVPRPAFDVVLDASIEVRGAVVYATFAVVLVFMPVITMSGLGGRIFAPLGFAYILAILASLLVALTVTPALCLLLLGSRELPAHDPPVVAWSKRHYHSLLTSIERRPRIAIAAVVIFVAFALALIPYLGSSFLPELREGHFVIHMSAIPGTSLQESLRTGRQITRALLKLPYVRSVDQRAGRAEASEDVWGTHYSEMDVALDPKQPHQERAQAQIRDVLARTPGLYSSVKTFLTERVEETLSGYTAAVVVNVVGNDLDVLDQQSRVIADLLQNVRGAREVQVQSPPGMPHVVVRLRQADVARWGLDPVEVLDAISAAYQGERVGQLYEGNRVFDVGVILQPEDRNSISAIGNLPLRTAGGSYIQLKQVAGIHESSGRYIVLHQGARRIQAITCNVVGRDLTSFVADAQKKIAGLKMPAGVYVEFSGSAAAQAQSRRDLLVHSALAGFGILLLLSVVMANYRNLLLVLANLPFALVGGVIAAFITGGVLSIGSLVGFVTLFGITLRNSIMMISHYEHLVSVEGMTWGWETAIRGAMERLAPILMTALVTGLGLLPLAIGSGAPGREIEGPMAIVILGGLFTSTALNLLILPTLALRYGRFTSRS